MTIEVVCNDCGEETSLCGFFVNHDIVYTKFKDLYDSKNFDINVWIEQMRSEDRVSEKDNIIYIDEEPILDEMERFERNPICPECGSANCEWF